MYTTAIEIINKLTLKLHKETTLKPDLIQRIVTEATDQELKKQGIKLVTAMPPGLFTNIFSDENLKVKEYKRYAGWKQMPIISKEEKLLTSFELKQLNKHIYDTAKKIIQES